PSERFAERHASQGTVDPAAYLAVPAAITFHREHLQPAREDCHTLLAEFLPFFGTPVAVWFEQMASVELSPCDPAGGRRRLWQEDRMEVVAEEWNGRPLLRLAVQVYNTREDLQTLADALHRQGLSPKGTVPTR